MLVAALLLPVKSAAAQTHSRFVEARAGANLVGNTYRVRQEKATFGGGASAGLFLSRYWMAEVEYWVRSASPECCTRREQLISLTAGRLYAAAGLQPYLAGGLALRGTDGIGQGAARRIRLQVQVTAGVRVPIGRRMAIDLDLRGNGGGS